MRVKEIARIACAAALVAGAAGCGDDEGAAAGGSGPKEVRVAVVLPALDNAFYVAEKAGVEAQAGTDPNADVTVSAGRQRTSADEVIGAVEDAIAKGVDAIAVNGSDDKPLIPVLRRVIDNDIPLVLFDAPADELKGQVAGYIGTDNSAGGRAAGEWLKSAMPRGGDVGVLLCVAGHPVTNARLGGFKEAIRGAGFKLVSTIDAECDREKGRKVMEDMVAAHPDLDAVFSTSDTQSLGAIEALKATGNDLEFVSFDAQPEAVKAIESGNVLDASAGWSARQLGADAVKAAIAAARGQKLPPSRTVPVTVVDRKNAHSWKG